MLWHASLHAVPAQSGGSVPWLLCFASRTQDERHRQEPAIALCEAALQRLIVAHAAALQHWSGHYRQAGRQGCAIKQGHRCRVRLPRHDLLHLAAAVLSGGGVAVCAPCTLCQAAHLVKARPLSALIGKPSHTYILAALACLHLLSDSLFCSVEFPPAVRTGNLLSSEIPSKMPLHFASLWTRTSKRRMQTSLAAFPLQRHLPLVKGCVSACCLCTCALSMNVCVSPQ